MNTNASKVALPSSTWGYNVFHLLFLDSYTAPIIGQLYIEQHLERVEQPEECKVDSTVDSRCYVGTLYYLSQWAGYIQIHTSWQWAEHFEIEHGLVENLK